MVVGAEYDAERFKTFAGQTDGEEQKGSGEESEELPRSRRLASGRGQRDGLGGHRAGSSW